MTSKRAVELKLQSLNFPSYFAFVPTAEDMKLSPRAFHRKMCSGQEVAGHAGFYVMVQYSVSQLCSELQKLESWSAAHVARPFLRAGWAWFAVCKRREVRVVCGLS